MTYRDKTDLIKTMRRLKICVLMPTYNNAGTLRRVITEVLNYSSDVIVVNDGSTDSTNLILDEFKDSIKVISYEQNQGKGFALKTGFKKALELGYEYAITIDSDGQHYAEDLPKFVRAIAENNGALIVGERNLSNVDINGKSSFANKFSNFWFCVQTGKRLNDTQTGYRAYPLNKLHGLSLLTSRYEAELELLVFAAWNGVEIVSIPIMVYYPPQSERVSHFKPALDFTRISILNTILCGGAILYGLPARIWIAFSQKRIFNADFKLFTHKKGSRKEAATTLGRLARSLYGITYFVFWSMGVFTPMAYIYFSIGKNTENKKLRFHKMLQWISTFLTNRFPGCKTTFINADNETFEKPALIICNHQSHLDLPVLMSVHPKLIFLTNDWVWNNFFYGKIIHNAEFLPVSAGMDVILPQLKDLKNRGYSIVVFPEGTRSADCSILRFHQGAFLLAQELELDIVPMVLHGAGYYLPKKDFMFRKGEITLSILPRVSIEEHAELALRERASIFRKLIRKEYDKLVLEKENDSYFQSLILYKYAYRGWKIVSRCKSTLKEANKYSTLLNGGHNLKKVRIINSGIGTFALLYALINKSVEVWAYESNLADYKIASETASLPKNLHFIHAVWNSEFKPDGETYDLTIILDGNESITVSSESEIYLPLKS